MDTLPKEIKSIICLESCVQTLKSLAQTSSSWYELCLNECLWKNKTEKLFPLAKLNDSWNTTFKLLYKFKLVVISAKDCCYCQEDNFKEMISDLKQHINVEIFECSCIRLSKEEFPPYIYSHATYYPKLMIVINEKMSENCELKVIDVLDIVNTPRNFENVFNWFNQTITVNQFVKW